MRKMLAVVLIVLAGVFMLSVPSVMAGPLEDVPCNGNFDGDDDVDSFDLTEFLIHFGRGFYVDPCPPDVSCGGVPKTGQTLCYDEFGDSIDCAGTGQDGNLQKGIQAKPKIYR